MRRLDDAALFWTFLAAGPLELAAAVVLIGVVLNFQAACSGIALLLLLIPVQVEPRCLPSPPLPFFFFSFCGGRELQSCEPRGAAGGIFFCGG